MRRVWGWGLLLCALAIGSVEAIAQTSALRGLQTPARISTNTVNPQSALKGPNLTSPLQTPIRSRPPSVSNFPKLSLATWPPRFSGSSILPKFNNPFQPTKTPGRNPFDTAIPAKNKIPKIETR